MLCVARKWLGLWIVLKLHFKQPFWNESTGTEYRMKSLKESMNTLDAQTFARW